MLRVMRRFLLILAALLTLPAAAFAQPDAIERENAAYSRAGQIVRVMQGELPAEAVFAPSFLAAVPAQQLEALTAQLVDQYGRVVASDDASYKGNGAASFDVLFEKARGAASLQLAADAPYQVTGFRISSMTPQDDTPEKILDDLAALPGTAGIGVYRLAEDRPQPVLGWKADMPMAVGSTFKLYVLSALAREIREGRRNWDDIVPLQRRSVPSGQMQDWPENAPVTLQTLATMMISISDNTATDTLMRLLGREALAAEVIASGHSVPERTLPLLTTVELFALKSGDPARIAAYSAADRAGRAALLEQWAPSLVRERVDGAKLAGSEPVAIDSIEWFASAGDIARLFQRLRDLDDPTVLKILAANPALPQEEREYWSYTGYKGGSEAGVLNLSWLLADASGDWYVVSASWNDPAKPLDNTRLELLAMRILGMLHQ